MICESYQRVLADEALPVSLLASFYLTTGLGYIKLGRAILARRALAQALDISTQAALNQITIQADEALAGIDVVAVKASARRVANLPRPAAWSPALAGLRAAVDRLHAGTVAQ
jgi:hypothetical protein